MICMARTLGAPLTVPAGKAALSASVGSLPSRQRAAHRRDHVDDVRVELHLHELVDLDGAGHADAAEVVAAEVDQHDVLGALLLVGAQVVDEAPVLGGARAPPAGAGDRPRLDAVALDGDERLGARAAEGEVVEGDVVQVRARVHGAEAAVDGEGRHVDRRAEALARARPGRRRRRRCTRGCAPRRPRTARGVMDEVTGRAEGAGSAPTSAASTMRPAAPAGRGAASLARTSAMRSTARS